MYGFEPDAISYKKCQRNININDFQNISLNNYGLGDKHHNVTLETIENKNRGMNKIINFQNYNAKNDLQKLLLLTLYFYRLLQNLIQISYCHHLNIFLLIYIPHIDY